MEIKLLKKLGVEVYKKKDTAVNSLNERSEGCLAG